MTDRVGMKLGHDGFQRIGIEPAVVIGADDALPGGHGRKRRQPFGQVVPDPRHRQEGPEPMRQPHVAHRAQLFPKPVEVRARSIPPPGHQPRLQRGPVQRPRRGAGDTGDLHRLILKQPVENAPGKGAMRAAALKGDIDPPNGHTALLLRCPNTPGGSRGAGPPPVSPACAGDRPPHIAVQPPSTEIVVPVICAAASEHRNTAVPPISSTVANWREGWRSSITSRITVSRSML